MSVRLMLLVVASVFSASMKAYVPLATNAHSFAFWPMNGESTGAVFTDPNYSQSATSHSPNLESVAICGDVDYDKLKIACRTYGDGYVVITDDIPGRYLFTSATDKMPMCDDYRSLRCVNYTSDHPGTANPSIWIKSLCDAMRKHSAWTLEYFVKNIDASGGLSYFDISGDAYRTTLEFPMSKNSPNKVRLSAKLDGNEKSTVTFEFPEGIDLSSDAKWHHIALVYCQTQEQIDKGEDGDFQLYVDYRPAPSSIKVRRDTSKVSGECRIRSAIGDGHIAAPRFTTKVLSVDELMRASDEQMRNVHDTVAYYPFDEQPQGILLETVDAANYTSSAELYANQISGNSSLSGKSVTLGAKAAEGKGGVAFVSTNVVPARYIYSNLSATVPLREPRMSLFVNDGTYGRNDTDSGLYGTYMNLNGMSKALNCELEDWTMEWFFKFEKEPGATMMYCKLYKDGDGSQITLGRNMNRGANEVRIKTESADQTVKYPDLTSLADGKWHHFAIVCKNDNLRLYCDYLHMTGGDLPAVRNSGVADVDETRFFQSCQRGMLSNLRVTSAALEPCDFLYASDSAAGVLGTSGYQWSLDGTKGMSAESIIATMSTLPTDTDQYLFSDWKGLVGSVAGDGTATYADAVFSGRRLIGNVDCGYNHSSVELSGVCVKGGEIAPLCRLGRVFTVEACVNATAPAAGSSVVFGAETTDGASAWRMLLDSDGALKLEVTLSTGVVVEKEVVASGISGNPKYLAVTADLAARLFKVYVDRNLALMADESSLCMPLVDGPVLVVGGGCGGSMLDGRVDEIRVSREILERDDFERLVERGLTVILK